MLLTFLYIASVVAAFLLAKPIRNGLFLNQFGAYKLVYVYVAVPLVLTVFVPLYTAIAPAVRPARGHHGNAALLLRQRARLLVSVHLPAVPVLSAIFYIWVNCFGIIAPVQVWIFANSIFDTRQAKRLFGLVASGASLGAIMGGLLATTLVGPARRPGEPAAGPRRRSSRRRRWS